MIDDKSLDISATKIEQLRQLFPEAVSEGKVDFQRLRHVLGDDEVVFHREHYELNWAGKSEARAEIQKQTSATLIPDSEGIDAEDCGNIFIEGENLEVLHVLQRSYFGKVKMIYIDPPYNTGNDSFVYPDDYTERQSEYKKRTGITDENGLLNKQDLWKKNVKESGHFHSVWLSMMYPRLYLARNLLREDGVIFISIDDNEQANLRQLMDEIFGADNFVGCIVWKNVTDNNPTNISTEHEYLLVFAKNKERLDSVWKSNLSDSKEKLNDIWKELSAKHTKLDELQAEYSLWFKQNKTFLGKLDRYKYIDFDGVYTGSQSVHNPGREGYRYDIIHPTSGKPCKQPLMGYRFPQETMKRLLHEQKILFGDDENKIIELKVYAAEFKDKLSSLIDLDGRIGAYDLRDLFHEAVKVFNNPKPVNFLESIFSYILNSEDTIFDFFAGSGTTAHATLTLNEQDGGNRQFICVQMPEVLDEKSEAYKAGYRNIADICKARISKVINKLQAERDSNPENTAQQPLGFKSFKIAPSNFKQWRDDTDVTNLLEQLDLHRFSEQDDSNNENRLIELLLKSGRPLTAKVETHLIDGQTLYNVESGEVLMFFDIYNPAVKAYILNLKPKKVVCLDRVFHNNDEALSNFKLNLKDSGIELQII
ncbi:MAG: site-specific DNA-methyltransferase [Methylococcaceae bacterium]|nr:site-specific DNA-methyltransferase [Methylococcaceae bacterium]